MHIERRKSAGGKIRYSFRYRDSKTGRLMRLPQNQTPVINDDNEAEQFCRKWEAESDCARVRARRRIEWRSRYYNFDSLLEIYTEHMKKEAPNSWNNNVFYMRNYVLAYFLVERACPNLEMWGTMYQDFREWLENEAELIYKKRDQKLISYSSKNHAIKALNTFLRYMFLKNQVQRFTTCPTFKSHLINSRTADDLVRDDEFDVIHRALQEVNVERSDF